MIRDSIVVSISACHAEDPGSIPGRGVFCELFDLVWIVRQTYWLLAENRFDDRHKCDPR